jgi:hypothetical protein
MPTEGREVKSMGNFLERRKELSEALRAKARELCGTDLPEGERLDRAVIAALQMALFDAYRDEWRGWVAELHLENELEVAKRMMRDEAYTEEMFDVICGRPGSKPQIAMVDGKEAVCFEYMATAGPMPLSAYFVDKVREAIDIAAKVGDLVVKSAGGQEGERGADDASSTVGVGENAEPRGTAEAGGAEHAVHVRAPLEES